MANELTGDFDVVAEFAIPAVNRLLAAMHRIGRFPHSAAMQVDDTPPRGPHRRPSAVEVVDALGDPIVDPGFIRTPIVAVGELSDATYSRFGGIVNIGDLIAQLPPIVPSHLKGRAQLQLSPPTVDVADGSKVKVRLQIMARYLPDAGTSPAAEFVLAVLEMTAPVNQVASQVARVLAIDIKANSVQVTFTPIWSSRPLSAEDLAGINLLIRNALKTSFQPSNITLPSTIQSLQVKALTSGAHAVAILLKTTGSGGNPGTVNNVFLGGGDDFAFAAGIDFVRSAFQPTIDQILSQPVPPVSFNISTLLGSIRVVYTITLNGASVDLENGRIVLTIKGHAHTGRTWLPDFDFTVRQLFTLQPDGATANLIVGDLSLDTSSWIVDRFRGAAVSALTGLRDRAIGDSGVAATVRRLLSAEENLGAFLRALLTPARRDEGLPLAPQHQLAYTNVTIIPSGIVLHGSLGVRGWPPAHVEFEQIPAQPRGPHDLPTSGPEYSAFKTWIPGGTIQSYEWKPLGQTQPGAIDEHKFVRLPPPTVSTVDLGIALTHGYAPMCLTVHGSRLSWSGPVVAQPVTATFCAFDSFPVVSGITGAVDDSGPLVALTRPAPNGLVEVVGHASAGSRASHRPRPNVIVHFADAKTARQLDRLADAVRESGRKEATTSIVAVFTKAEIAKTPYATGIVYTDDENAWERAFGSKVSSRPATIVVNPKGEVVWRHEGDIDAHQLAAALRKVLVGSIPVVTRTVKSNVSIGHPPPNFLFEFADGQQLALNKLTGTPIELVFWRSTSQPSVDAVLREKPAQKQDSGSLTLLAINDGEPADLARRVAAEHRLPGILVTDPRRAISSAYGVNAWPMRVAIDASGVVTELSYGRNI